MHKYAIWGTATSPSHEAWVTAVGKAFEDAKDAAASFAHYDKGNALRRTMILHDADTFSAEVQAAKQTFTAAFIAAVLLATAVLVIKGGPDMGTHFGLLSNYFPGFSVTWFGFVVPSKSGLWHA